jgi:hypothetical protein
MQSFALVTGEVQDEALRYVYAFGGAPLLGTIGVVAVLALFAHGAARVRLALGRRHVVRRSVAAACARP